MSHRPYPGPCAWRAGGRGTGAAGAGAGGTAGAGERLGPSRPPHRPLLRCALGILASQGTGAYVAAQPLFLHSAAYASAHHEKILAEIEHGTATFQGEDTLRKRIGALRTFDVMTDLPSIRHPTLVAAAKDDLLVPYTASEALAAGLPNATLWLTDHGAHACTVENPAPFNAVMMNFFSATPNNFQPLALLP